ncbi:MAG: DUF2110 family protein [Candidatus Thorarchaeota archaeon]
MIRVTLQARAYGPYRKWLLRTLKTDLERTFADLDVDIVGLDTEMRGHVVVDMEGEDVEFAANVLGLEYGTAPSFDQLSTGFCTRGYIVEVGRVGYGLYVDIGVIEPARVDALIPLHKLRFQLAMERSLRYIARTWVLADHLPVEVKLTDVNRTNQTIEAELSEETLARLRRWAEDDHERLLVLGVTRKMIDRALYETGHTSDIYEVESLGVYEYALACKRSTRASGILAAIGPVLRGVPIHLFIPNEVKANLDGAT